MPPAIQVVDFQSVDLSLGPVLFATYSPTNWPKGTPPHDVTQLVRQVQMTRSDLMIHGGIHTVIGDPFPNIAKSCKIYLANRESISFAICAGDQPQFVSLDPTLELIAASYVNEGDDKTYNDVFDKIRALQMEGRNTMDTVSLRRILGDDSMKNKKLKIWYA